MNFDDAYLGFVYGILLNAILVSFHVVMSLRCIYETVTSSVFLAK